MRGMARLKIDTREDKLFVRKLRSRIEGDVIVLDAGDYWIQTEDKPIVIERSTYSDFVGKIMSGRLFKQVEKCLSVSNHVIFAIEFEGRHWNNYNYCSFPRAGFIGMLGSLTMRGVFPIILSGPSDTIQLISYFYNKIWGKKKEYNPLVQRTQFKGIGGDEMQVCSDLPFTIFKGRMFVSHRPD